MAVRSMNTTEAQGGSGTSIEVGQDGIHLVVGWQDAYAVLELLTGKWAVGIMLALGVERRRNRALKRAVGCGISDNRLTAALRRLEEYGLVVRHDRRSVPPVVEYELSAPGRALLPVLEALGSWWGQHAADIAGTALRAS